MTRNSIEISVRGRWLRVPALAVKGNTIVITGRYLKVAAIHDEDWLEGELEDPETCIKRLKNENSQGSRADIFTFTQKVPATVPRYPYDVERESIAAIRLTTFKNWWEKLPQESRKNVRRSERRGVVVRIRYFDDELIQGILEVTNESPVRQGRRYPHYGKRFDEIRRDHSAFLDRSDFICAYSGNELIGFLKLVYRGNIGSILQLLSKASHYDKRPSNALLAKAVELCAAKRMQCLTYAKYHYGNKRGSSLTEFKSRNGFEEILMPRYYIPLTPLGTLAVKLKLYRGMLGILPGSVLSAGLGARAKWYDIKQSFRAGVAQR